MEAIVNIFHVDPKKSIEYKISKDDKVTFTRYMEMTGRPAKHTGKYIYTLSWVGDR